MDDWALEAAGLHKHFGSVHAVQGLDLRVRRGEIFGLLGPNGAGKTTSLEMLEGLQTPDAGTIRVLGLDWRQDAARIRGRIGVQFQSTELDDHIRVAEALELFAGYYPNPRPVGELLRRLQLEDKAQALQKHLSGGQRQRLALGLALVHDPELVFLDEPTTGLDPQARQGLWSLVRELQAEGRTILLTTHYMEEAEALCDRVGILDHGRILSLGTPRALIDALAQPSHAELAFTTLPPDAEAFAACLGREVSVQGQTWSIALDDVRQDLQQVLNCVEQLGLPLDRLHVRRASLEDVFLQSTGRSLRD